MVRADNHVSRNRTLSFRGFYAISRNFHLEIVFAFFILPVLGSLPHLYDHANV